LLEAGVRPHRSIASKDGVASIGGDRRNTGLKAGFGQLAPTTATRSGSTWPRAAREPTFDLDAKIRLHPMPLVVTQNQPNTFHPNLPEGSSLASNWSQQKFGCAL
jgi:hypothetical protein